MSDPSWLYIVHPPIALSHAKYGMQGAGRYSGDLTYKQYNQFPHPGTAIHSSPRVGKLIILFIGQIPTIPTSTLHTILCMG